jgi:hypothetical protein
LPSPTFVKVFAFGSAPPLVLVPVFKLPGVFAFVPPVPLFPLDVPFSAEVLGSGASVFAGPKSCVVRFILILLAHESDTAVNSPRGSDNVAMRRFYKNDLISLRRNRLVISNN